LTRKSYQFSRSGGRATPHEIEFVGEIQTRRANAVRAAIAEANARGTYRGDGLTALHALLLNDRVGQLENAVKVLLAVAYRVDQALARTDHGMSCTYAECDIARGLLSSVMLASENLFGLAAADLASEVAADRGRRTAMPDEA
jgi:hypothetical protein